MMKFTNLKTSAKLVISHGVLVVLAVLLGVIVLSRLYRIGALGSRIVAEPLAASNALVHITDNVKQHRIHAWHQLVVKDPKERDGLDKELSGELEELDHGLEAYGKAVTADEDKKNFQSLTAMIDKYKADSDKASQSVHSGDLASAESLMNGGVQDDYEAINKHLDEMLEASQKDAARFHKQIETEQAGATRLAAGLLFLATILGVSLATAITRLIARPLKELASVATDLAEGRCDHQISIDRQDEVGTLAESFRRMVSYQKAMADAAQSVADGDLTVEVPNHGADDLLGTAFGKMVLNLRDLVSEVTLSASLVASTSEQLSAFSADAARQTSDMSLAVEEVAGIGTKSDSTLRQMERSVQAVLESGENQSRETLVASEGINQVASAVEEIAHSASQMAVMAEKSAAVAAEGGQAVRDAESSMDRINSKVKSSSVKIEELSEKSKAITVIVQTIEGIADQTNLLALNAAIEAARAGDSGRGFAVVAEEVRKLAERSGLAAREINELVGGVQGIVEEAIDAMNSSTKEVAEGALKSQQATSALSQIEDAVRTVAGEVQQVSAATSQMAHTVESVRASVITVQKGAENNTASVDQMAKGASAVAGALDQISGISHLAAAGAEEMHASALDLSKMATQLDHLVEKFNLGKDKPVQKAVKKKKAA